MLSNNDRLNAWRRNLGAKRSTKRDPLHKPNMPRVVKRAYGCEGGPFDGAKVWLSGVNAQDVQTIRFVLAHWHGRYVYKPDCDTKRGNRKVIWKQEDS